MAPDSLTKVFQVFSCDYWRWRYNLWVAMRDAKRTKAAINKRLQEIGISASPIPLTTEVDGIETVEGYRIRKYMGEEVLGLGRPATKEEKEAFVREIAEELTEKIEELDGKIRMEGGLNHDL